MKIAILGTRGVPNNHGGFEQFAESLSEHLVKNGHEVIVYNSHKHPFQDKIWKGTTIVHKYDPEYLIGNAGQFIYDLGCVLHTRKQGFDVILQLGYTSSSVWNRLFNKETLIITNMDGLEWKRTKYKKPIQKFLKYAERLAIKHSDFLIADSLGIKAYLYKKYGVDSKYIAYGATVFDNELEEIISEYSVSKGEYDMLVARLEPENNIEIILDGVTKSKVKRDFLVIGKHNTKYGEFLKSKYKNYPYIRFTGGIYNQNHLDNLRYFSNLYFHGHSVGGTNPSLLEAMASGALIIAHNNVFNESILGENAFYFKSAKDVTSYLNLKKASNQDKIQSNIHKIRNEFTSNYINSKYETFFKQCVKNETRNMG